MGISQKLFDVMNETESLEKDLKVGSGSNSYKAVGEKTVLNMLKPLFKKHRLIIFPKDGDITEHEKVWEESYNGKPSTKKRFVTQLRVYFTVVDVDSNETIDIVGFGNGADSQDKGSGKAFTYAFKTALNKTFMMFSGEDTDNTHSDDISGNQPTEQKITEDMLKDAIAYAETDTQTILDSYCKKFNKRCTELKFMSQEGKLYYYNRMMNSKNKGDK